MATKFTPEWSNTAPRQGTYRSIFKWGAPDKFKHPNNKLFETLKTKFGLTDTNFHHKQEEGLESVTLDRPLTLNEVQINAFRDIVGVANVAMDDYSRVKFATGKTIEETMILRKGSALEVADLVVHPRSREDLEKIMSFCTQEKIPIYIYGGGSSVTKGLTCKKGGISLVLSTHMNRILELNETNQTVTVEAGMMGPAFEKMLNDAPRTLNARRAYTCGHFPQSFEYSSVGGWVVTLGSGQESSYYGDAYDLVISQEYITPTGAFKTLDYPATATGPKVNDIMKGSEGAFGILVSVTMKVFRYMPENRKRFAFIFPDWESAVNAAREVTQSEFGMPAVFRISDAEETSIGLKLYGVEDTPIDKFMTMRGYQPNQRCLLIGSTAGAASFSGNVKKQIKKVCKEFKGMYITGYAVNKWETGRYADPYMREDLQDYGIIIDTLESGVTWDALHKLHRGVRDFVKSRPDTICMTHASHFYPQGTNLYFIFIAKMNDVEEYKEFQNGIMDAINRHGGSLSHHHGVGKMLSPLMEAHLGGTQMDILRTLKKHFDPDNIMNPGGTLSLDL